MGSVAEAKLRVTLLGTSNSVLRSGFRQPLEADDRLVVRNLSIGASGSILVGFRTDEEALRSSDILLLEFAVNEENFVREGSSSVVAITNAMRGIVDRACRAGCVPVVVLMPNLPFLEEPIAAPAMADVFRRAGLPVFDVGALIRRAADLGRGAPRPLFSDPKHLKRSVARAVSVLLIEALLALPRDKRQPLRETAATYRPITFVPGTELAVDGEARVIERSTSLVSMTGALLQEGAAFRLSSPDGPSSLVGLMVNAARSRASLVAEDGEVLRFSVPDARWSDDPKQFTLVARPVAPTQIGPGGRLFTVVPAAAGGAIQLELFGVFLRSRGAPIRMAVTPMPGKWRDLGAGIDETSLRMIASLAHSSD